MSTQASNKLANTITYIVLFLTTFQGLIPAIPIKNNHTVTLLSAVVMLLVTTGTYLKNFLSTEIAKAAQKATHILFAIAVLGGLNDFFDLVKFNEITDQWIRFGITLAITFLNLLAKLLYPTPETKSLI